MALNIPITLRTVKGDKLTWEEADNNFANLKLATNTTHTLVDGVSTTVADPLTGLAKAHTKITGVENAINSPTTGLLKAHIKIAEVTSTLEQAMAGLVPSLNFVGSFSSAPTSIDLGSAWIQNAIYKNVTDSNFYVLTGTPLAWVVYMESGTAYYLTIESSNGTSFKTGFGTHTTLKARLFKNGAEVTELTPDSWFGWRRVSKIPKAYPDDDDSWNSVYSTGYKQIDVPVDDISANATFFCDITA